MGMTRGIHQRIIVLENKRQHIYIYIVQFSQSWYQVSHISKSVPKLIWTNNITDIRNYDIMCQM